MPPSEDTIRIQVRGTTAMAVYDVQGNTLMLASADFGNAQAPLDGAPPDEVASRLLRALAETAMARDGDLFMRDDGSPQQES